MTTNWLPLLLLAASPSPDSRALDPATATAIVEPLAKCVRGRIAAHRVDPAQVGRMDSARNFATRQMSLCGAADVQARLIAAMSSADPALTPDEGLRRAGALLGTVLSEAAMQASRRFRVAPIRVQMIYCPRKTKPQPEECKEPPAPAVAPIEVPYQAQAFHTYTRCVMDRYLVAIRSPTHKREEARQAHFDSVAACRDVRAIQLARALEQVTDRKIYGSRAKAQEMTRLAFDRFDREPPSTLSETINPEPAD